MDESPDLLETLSLARDFLAREIPGPIPRTAVDDQGGDPSASMPSQKVSMGLAAAAVDDQGDDPLALLAAEAGTCQKCGLAQTRMSVVFGSGRADADLVFVGEAPGAEEDRQGVPFVGAAGQLLTRMIEAIDLAREDVYIANIVKCRPPNNRDPKPDEIAACRPYLERQLELIAPVVICTLGRFAAQTLLQTTESIGRLRGRVFDRYGAKVVPTYHPAALLRNQRWKRPTWEDLKLVRKLCDGTEI